MGVDLTNCDREPIHIPGKIQGHGYLIAMDQETGHVMYCSNNIEELLEHPPKELLGKSLNIFEKGSSCFNNYKRIEDHINLIKKEGLQEEFSFLVIEIHNVSYYAIFSVSGRYLVIEFEKALMEFRDKGRINSVVRKMVNQEKFDVLFNDVTQEIKRLIDYDRVMIYQFLEDGSGKVIAENKNENLESYLDLHYPESDIPKQARALYVINKVRLIADVQAEDSPLLSLSNEILDMTHCRTRAVSPMHIEYLKNMGVASSFSVSIVVDGNLWGLISCHNYTPKTIDFSVRQSAELLGEIISSVISNKSKESSLVFEGNFRRIHQEYQKRLMMDDYIDNVLFKAENNLLSVTEASGVAMFFEENFHQAGKVPPKEFVLKLIKWFLTQNEGDIFHTNNLTGFLPEAEAYTSCCSGVLIMVLSRETGDAIVWFKPEIKSIITWAGKPEKSVEIRKKDGNMVYEIHPRKSFEAYSELISNKSDSWSKEELKSAEKVKQIVLETSLRKSKELKTLNEKLKEAYDELDTFSYTISHDLKTPLTVIKVNAQLAHRMTDDPSIKDKMQKIVSGTNEMTEMMDEILNLTKLNYSEVLFDTIEMKPLIKKIVEECIIAYNNPKTEVRIGEIYDLRGDQIMIYQLFTNLIGNAIKYSSKVESPVIQVDSRSEKGTTIYEVKDNGIGMNPEDLPKIFELFTRFSNAKAFGGSGVGMTIVKRIMDKHHGEIGITSKVGEGTTFILKFNQ